MPVRVLMPQLGESVVEGTITKWLKAKGDRIAENEPLLEVNTDKVDTEIPSPASGTLLEVLVEEGVTVLAGALLAWIGDGEEIVSTLPSPEHPVAAAPEPETALPVPLPARQPALVRRDGELGFISPVVAKIAREQNIDLRQVRETGQAGRITKRDALAYLEKKQAEPAGKEMAEDILPLSPVRRLTAEHMVLSKRASPHVTTVMEADLSRVTAHRQARKQEFELKGVNLTFMAYFVAATVTALKAYPLANSSWSEQGIRLHKGIHIGMATSIGEAGLIVPVIHDADGYNLLGLARMVNDLASRARARQLKPGEVKGGTFTITNHGVSGSLFATPIINQPQCAILGVGAIQKRLVVVTDPLGGDAIAIRPMVYLSLSFDHRILDGAMADAFLTKVVESLQNWED